MKFFLYLFLLFCAACNNTRYFIVRHAEKTALARDSAGMMANNPPLSEAGKVRAVVLREELKNKHIKHIYSTNTIRTVSTAAPLAAAIGLPVEIYNTRDSLNQFIEKLKTTRGNTLIIGHSNTVDDIVNKLCGQAKIPGDLKDSEYDNLYIIQRKGKKMIFSQRKYGYPSAGESNRQ